MSKYFTVKGLKARVSDHEPNFSMNKFRGTNDIELYTISADNKKLSIEDQIDRFLTTPLAYEYGIIKSDFNKILGKKENRNQVLKKEYNIIDIWFSDIEDNKDLIKDLKRNPNWFVPLRLNAQQKKSWLKYLNKKLKDV